MRLLTAAAVIVSIAASCTMAGAAIYQWQDDKGVVHFTDNSDSIPARYEKRVKEIAGKPAAEEKPKAAAAAASVPAPPAVPVAEAAVPTNTPLSELQAIRAALPGKKKELARLHRKWLIAKGRTPSKDEIEKFEKKRAKGEAKLEDNPYINKNPLSTPGPARLAYYKMLDEIKRDEERIRQLESGLAVK